MRSIPLASAPQCNALLSRARARHFLALVPAPLFRNELDHGQQSTTIILQLATSTTAKKIEYKNWVAIVTVSHPTSEIFMMATVKHNFRPKVDKHMYVQAQLRSRQANLKSQFQTSVMADLPAARGSGMHVRGT